MPIVPRLRFIPLISFGLLLVFSAGCSSDPGPGRPGGQAGHRKPPAPMAGQGTFFDGKIVAELSVGDLGLPAGQPDGGAGERVRGGGHGRPGGGRASLSMGVGGGGGHVSNHRERGEGSPRDEGSPEGMRPMMGSMAPPVLIHLWFTNKGTERVELRIVDFSSPLGNFAVQPDRLALDPGQSVETEPMSSLLAEGLAQTEATLVLRIGDQTEKKAVVVRAVPAAAKTEEPALAKPNP